MNRYNHRLAERRWGASFPPAPSLEQEKQSTCLAVLVPPRGDYLDLENSRLLVLTDFFGYLLKGKRPIIHCLGNFPQAAAVASQLGLQLSFQPRPKYELLVVARDYQYLAQEFVFTRLLPLGRFFGQMEPDRFLPDFGADALRVFFLFQGPPKQDYRFSYSGLAGAYRFLQKVWRLSWAGRHHPAPKTVQEAKGLEQLRQVVQFRLGQEKPHTALAAIMGFLRKREFLSTTERSQIATLLLPYAPFMARELLKPDTFY